MNYKEILLFLSALHLVITIYGLFIHGKFSTECQYVDYENNKYRLEVYLKEKYLFTIPITFTAIFS